MNARIIVWAISSALAGFLFGFDTVVISGAEQTIQSLWGLSAGLHGIAMASALYGTVLGSLLGSWPTDRFGRRPTLIMIGALYVITAVGSAFANDVYSFIIARMIGGFGIGVSTIAAPLYISEVAPPKFRGRLAGLYQFNIVFGIVVAFASNALIADVGDNAWRWMLGVATFPSVLYLISCFFIPESPRWLLDKKGDRAAARAVLHRIEPDASEAHIEAEIANILAGSTPKAAAKPFWNSSLRTPIMLAIFIAIFNQLSGINAILYFAPRIFGMTGLGKHAAMLQSIGIGTTNLIFTFVGLWLIDRLGRRTLLYIGSFGYILSLGLASWAFFTNHLTLVPICIFAFIAAHAVGQGTVMWVFVAEIFPNHYRAQGQALGSFTHWICAAILTTIFPSLVAMFAPGYIFLFFAAAMVCQLIWVKTKVIETKGIPLEDMQRRLAEHAG